MPPGRGEAASLAELDRNGGPNDSQIHAYGVCARPALDIPYCHHEKWDGSGYPRGLRGPSIPLAARVFAVVDVWDALRSDRPYRPAWPEAQVRDHLRQLAGTHFDPRVVEAFLDMNAPG